MRARLRSTNQTQTRQELLVYSLSAYSLMAELAIRQKQDRRALELALELGALAAGRATVETTAARPAAQEVWLVLLPLRESLAVWRIDSESVAFREVKMRRKEFSGEVDRLLAMASAADSDPRALRLQGSLVSCKMSLKGGRDSHTR